MSNNNQNYDMTDEVIDTVIKRSGDKIIKGEDKLLDKRLSGMPDVSPSADFEKKMRGVFASERRKQRRKSYAKYGRIAAAFAAAVLVVTAVSILGVDAWRMKFYNRLINRNETNTDISLVESNGESGLAIENMDIKYIPDGFTLQETATDDFTGEIYYLLFRDDENNWFYLDVFDNNGLISANTEGAEVEEIKIRGNDAVLSKNNINGENIIIFNDQKYFYEVTGVISVDELINIANGFSKK